MKSFAFGIALVLQGCGLAFAQPALREEVHITSDVVTVGDFYSDAGDAAATALFRSPDLGTSGTVRAEVIAMRARQAGLADAGTDGLDAVIVFHDGILFDTKRLQAVVAEALTRQKASLTAGDVDVAFSNLPPTIYGDAQEKSPALVTRSFWSPQDGHFDISITFPGKASRRSITLTGTAREMVSVPALIQPLARGDLLKASDITMVRLPRNQVPARAVNEASQIEGMAAKTALRPGMALSSSDFELPTIVDRGERVTLVYQTVGMKLTAVGQAMGKGAMGDMVDITNLQSHRIVTGTVIGRGMVQVGPAPKVMASLEEASK